MKEIYTSSQGQTFEIVDKFHRGSDTWVTYRNQSTGQEYTARLAAFLARFRVQIQS